MSLSEVFNSVIILDDMSSSNGIIIIAGVLVGLFALACFALGAYRIYWRETVAGTVFCFILGVALAFLTVLLIYYYNTCPLYMKFFIASNGASVEDICVYFKVTDISSMGDNAYMYIHPKSEFYRDVLSLYQQNVI